MHESDTTILGDVFVTVLEQSSFMFAEIVSDKSEAKPSSELVRGAIRFDGDSYSGVIAIVIPDLLTKQLAANILGEDEESQIVNDQYLDALGELLNVLCGQFLTTVEGHEPIFNLSVPRVGVASANDWSTILKRENSVAICVDDEYSLLLDLKVKRIS